MTPSEEEWLLFMALALVAALLIFCVVVSTVAVGGGCL